ncbi:MAG: PHP domain-containing protein [Ruminococcaceae bacterium]|nr:PHP domain-containing protein [Oscillospiraceae bacterium]
MYLISPLKKQYKANLHCHSNLSDGKRTPWELKEMYKSHGYSVLAITDHESPNNHSYLNDEEFIALTGYEAYIRPGHKYDVYGKEVHINLFARDPENVALVCYNPVYCKYITPARQAELPKAGSTAQREFTVEYINKFVKTAQENGYIAAYNHPWWSMENEETVLQYEGFFSMEMCNYSSYLLGRLEYNAALYDKLILAGKRIFCHSADDNHNKYPDNSPQSDSFGGFTMIMADEFTYDSVFSAMERGEMYSSMGPLIKEVSVEGNKIHIECSEADRIMVFFGSKKPGAKFAEADGTITVADFEIDPRAKFVRVSVVDRFGNFADTRAFSRKEVGLSEE